MYGPFIWTVMSVVVIPLLVHRPPSINVRWWVQFVGHIPFVALPIVGVGFVLSLYLNSGGGVLFLVACSKAKASSINRGSLQEAPTNPTPNGAGFASNLVGNGGFGAFGIMPNGTTMIG